MDFLPLTLPTPEQDLALDEVLLDEADAGARGAVLRIWERAQLAVVLGASRPAERDVHLGLCAERGVPVLRRASAGGTVLLGPGCLIYSLVLDHRRAELSGGIRAVDSWVLERIAQALSRTGPALPVRRAGLSDLSVAGRKLSGNAQRRRRRFTLYHGTVLYAFDLAAISRLLPLPDRVPEYRAGRDHHEFVANLPLPREVIVGCLQQAFDAFSPAQPPDGSAVAALATGKHRDPAWIYSR